MNNIKLEKEQPKKQEDIFLAVSKEIEDLKNYYKGEGFDLKYNELKDKFLKESPKERLALELLFSVKNYVAAREKLSSFGKKLLGYKDLKESKEEVINLSSWNQKATEFLAKHEYDKEFARAFWSSYETIFNLFSNDKNSRDGVKRGIVGQASVCHILSHAGLKPEISTPQEDVFEKIDLKISLGGRNIAIQIKQHQKLNEPLILSAKDIKYPGIVSKGTDRDLYFSSLDIEEMTNLQESCQEKSRREKKKIEAFYIVIPSGHCDPDTGKPSSEFLKKIKYLIQTSLKK